MDTRKALLLVASHAAFAATGFAIGIYALPILIAPAAPTAEEIKAATAQTQFTGQFRRDLKDSDALHWAKEPYPSHPPPFHSPENSLQGRTTSSISLPNSLKLRTTLTGSRTAWSESGTSKLSKTSLLPCKQTLTLQSTPRSSSGARPLGSSLRLPNTPSSWLARAAYFERQISPCAQVICRYN